MACCRRPAGPGRMDSSRSSASCGRPRFARRRGRSPRGQRARRVGTRRAASGPQTRSHEPNLHRKTVLIARRGTQGCRAGSSWVRRGERADAHGAWRRTSAQPRAPASDRARCRKCFMSAHKGEHRPSRGRAGELPVHCRMRLCAWRWHARLVGRPGSSRGSRRPRHSASREDARGQQNDTHGEARSSVAFVTSGLRAGGRSVAPKARAALRAGASPQSAAASAAPTHPPGTPRASERRRIANLPRVGGARAAPRRGAPRVPPFARPCEDAT